MSPKAALYEPADRRGYTLRPNLRSVGPLGEPIATDDRGLRVGASSAATAPEPAGEVRILAVGDSFQFGLGVTAEDALPAQLQHALVARGADAQVWNAGVPGYNLVQSVRALEYWLPRLRPTVVVLGVLENDLHNVDGPDLVVRDDGTLTRREGAWDPLADVNPFAALEGPWLELQLQSAAFRWLSFRMIQRQLAVSGDPQLIAIADGAARSDALADRLLRGEGDEETNPRFEGAATLFERARDATAAAGAKLIVLLFPRPEQLVAPELRGGTARLAQTAAALGITTVDPAARLAEESNRVSLYLFPHDHHPGPRAHAIMAEELAGAIPLSQRESGDAE